jgi:putative intracellular protease/amidase
MAQARLIIPLPSRDFDPTEAAVSWAHLRAAGCAVSFATPDGAPAAADPRMLTGEGLDCWGFLPGLAKLKALGLLLRANGEARAAHGRMVQDPAFARPVTFAALDPADWDALLLPGGHAPGMRPYLESPGLQAFVAACFDGGKPVAAICHGVVLAARSRSPLTGRSVLHGRRTTALTWKLERSAWRLMKYAGRFWDPQYYRTYLEAPGEAPGHASVEAEVRRALASPAHFLDVDASTPARFRKGGLFRDTAADPSPAFVVQDGAYVSARWPGDAHLFAHTFVDVLREAGLL